VREEEEGEEMGGAGGGGGGDLEKGRRERKSRESCSKEGEEEEKGGVGVGVREGAREDWKDLDVGAMSKREKREVLFKVLGRFLDETGEEEDERTIWEVSSCFDAFFFSFYFRSFSPLTFFFGLVDATHSPSSSSRSVPASHSSHISSVHLLPSTRPLQAHLLSPLSFLPSFPSQSVPKPKRPSHRLPLRQTQPPHLPHRRTNLSTRLKLHPFLHRLRHLSEPQDRKTRQEEDGKSS